MRLHEQQVVSQVFLLNFLFTPMLHREEEIQILVGSRRNSKSPRMTSHTGAHRMRRWRLRAPRPTHAQKRSLQRRRRRRSTHARTANKGIEGSGGGVVKPKATGSRNLERRAVRKRQRSLKLTQIYY
jgi:hypothetical protein